MNESLKKEGNATEDLDQIVSRVDETAALWEQFLDEPADAERLLLLDEASTSAMRA